MKSLKDITTYTKVYVDGMNLCSRYYRAVKDCYYKGHNTGMLVGVMRFLVKMKKDHKHAKMFFLWEGKDSVRKERYPTYKASRKQQWQNTDEEFFDNLHYVQGDLLPHAAVTQCWCHGLEADDLAYHFATVGDLGDDVLLVSCDSDWKAFTNPLADLMVAKTIKTYDDLAEELGFNPDQLILYKILTGDSSDDVKGIPRFPTKVAKALTNEAADYTDCEQILRVWGKSKEADLLKSFEWKLKENAELLTPILPNPDDIVYEGGDFHKDKLIEALNHRGMEWFVNIVEGWE